MIRLVKLPIEYFELLKNNLFQRNTINNFFSKVTNTNNTGLKVSYKIAKLIAKIGKPHTIDEHLIKPVIKEIAAEFNENFNNFINSISLSNNTIMRRIDEMSDNIENKLYDYLKENLCKLMRQHCEILNHYDYVMFGLFRMER